MSVLIDIFKYNMQIHSTGEVLRLFRELKWNRFLISDKIDRRLRQAMANKSLRQFYRREYGNYKNWVALHRYDAKGNGILIDFDINKITELPRSKHKRIRLKYNMDGLSKRDYSPDDSITINMQTHRKFNQWVRILYTPMGNKR